MSVDGESRAAPSGQTDSPPQLPTAAELPLIAERTIHRFAGSVPRVVVLGGGFGGLHVTMGLAKSPVQVMLVDRTNHTLFQPLLYQVATAALEADDIAVPLRKVLRRQKNAEIMMSEVIGIDRQRREVTTTDRVIPYDYLVIAMGSEYNYFGHEDWKPIVPSLKNLHDAGRIRQKVLESLERAQSERDAPIRKALLTYIMVGGGPTGVELAGAIVELIHDVVTRSLGTCQASDIRVIIVEAAPRCLAQFDESLSHAAEKKLRSLGVEIRLGCHVESVDEFGAVVAGQRIESRNVFWTAGVKTPNLKDWLDVEVDRVGRVIVTSELNVPGDPAVFLVGDAAAISAGNGKFLPGVAQVAMQSGNYVAKAIRSLIAGEQVRAPFSYFDKGNMATVGRAFAVYDHGKIKSSGRTTWFLWLFIHIMYLSTFRSKIFVFFRWVWAYIVRDRAATVFTCDTADEL